MKKYFSLNRKIFLSIWLLALLGLAPLITSLGMVSSETSFVVYLLVFSFVFVLLLDKASFQTGVILAILLAIFWLYKPPFLSILIEGLNNRMQDTFFQLRGPKANMDEVVIVDVDKRSLDAVGQWPWPRSLIGKVVNTLIEDDVRVIGFDIVFAESGRSSLKDLAKNFQEIGFNILLPQKNLETSKTLIEDQDWNITLTGAQVKEMVLKHWENHFEALDEDFHIDNESHSDREKNLIDRYIEEDKKLWDAYEKYEAQRVERLGEKYEINPFVPPQNPLVEMSRRVSKLHFLDIDWDAPNVFENEVIVIVDNDEFLGTAMNGGRVIAGGYFILEQSAGSRLAYSKVIEANEETEGMIIQSGIRNAEDIFPFMLLGMDQVINVEELQERANFQGMFNVIPDKSGAARYYTLIMQAPVYEETLLLKEGLKDREGVDYLDLENYEIKIISQNLTYPSIALQMLRVANGYDFVEAIEKADGQKGLVLRREAGMYEMSESGEDPVPPEVFSKVLPKERFIPLDFKGDMRINYLGYGGKWKQGDPFGPEYYFSYISLSDVLQKRFPKGFFKEKYVLIGSTDPTLQDLVGNPFRPAFPGIEVHATMLDNLLSEDFLSDLGDFSTLYIFLGLLVGGVILSLLIAYAQAWLTVIYLLLVLITLPYFSYYAFVNWNIVVEFIYPWIAIILIGIVVVLVNFFVEGKEKRFLNATFKKLLIFRFD